MGSQGPLTVTPDGPELMALFLQALKRRLVADGLKGEDGKPMGAAELSVVARVLTDNSITIASVRAGEFGTYAQKVAEESFPWDDTNAPQHVQ